MCARSPFASSLTFLKSSLFLSRAHLQICIDLPTGLGGVAQREVQGGREEQVAVGGGVISAFASAWPARGHAPALLRPTHPHPPTHAYTLRNKIACLTRHAAPGARLHLPTTPAPPYTFRYTYI